MRVVVARVVVARVVAIKKGNPKVGPPNNQNKSVHKWTAILYHRVAESSRRKAKHPLMREVGAVPFFGRRNNE